MSWRAIGLAFALGLTAPAAFVQAAPVEYTPAQMRVLGYQLIGSGDGLAALQIADGLLERDKTDASAHLLRAQALELLQDRTKSLQAGRLAFKNAKDRDTSFSAAMFMANSLTSDQRNTAAQLWLRRAAQNAPNAASKAYARGEFDMVRSRNPLILSFDASVRPSSNVNNGSTATSFRNPGFPWLPPEILIEGEQRALSGVVSTFSADLTYRLPPTATTRTELLMHLDQSLVWLSPEAKLDAPEARAGNYAAATVEAGFVRLYRPLDSKLTYRFGAFAGHDWAAGRDLANRLRLELAGDLSISDGLSATASFSAEKQTRLDAAVRSSDIYGTTLALTKRLDKGDILQFSLSGRETETDSLGLQNTAVAARIVWRKAKPVAGMGISLSAVTELRDYPFSPYNPIGGRTDHRNLLAVTLDLNKVEYMGFSPSVNLTASDINSNVSLFSAREFGINLGFKSNF